MSSRFDVGFDDPNRGVSGRVLAWRCEVHIETVFFELRGLLSGT
jgi:hypothetical protein